MRTCHLLTSVQPASPLTAVVINQASIETVFSKKLSQYGDVVGDNIGKVRCSLKSRQSNRSGAEDGFVGRAVFDMHPPPSFQPPCSTWAPISWRHQVSPHGGGAAGWGLESGLLRCSWALVCEQCSCSSSANASLLTLSPAGGRFAGPLVVGGVTKIATPWGETGYCTEWATGADGSADCVGPWDQQCVITGE